MALHHTSRRLTQNDCEHVIDLFETFCRNGNIYMVLEYMNCGSLRDIIDTCGAIPEHALSKIAYQVSAQRQLILRCSDSLNERKWILSQLCTYTH